MSYCDFLCDDKRKQPYWDGKPWQWDYRALKSSNGDGKVLEGTVKQQRFQTGDVSDVSRLAALNAVPCRRCQFVPVLCSSSLWPSFQSTRDLIPGKLDKGKNLNTNGRCFFYFFICTKRKDWHRKRPLMAQEQYIWGGQRWEFLKGRTSTDGLLRRRRFPPKSPKWKQVQKQQQQKSRNHWTFSGSCERGAWHHRAFARGEHPRDVPPAAQIFRTHLKREAGV